MAGKKSELVKMAELARRSGVPAPTIKHYIREGLLPGPKLRTSPNVAFYDPRLAARIQVIKRLQAERFLPLRVIADLLEPAPSAAIRRDRDAAQRKTLVQLAPAIAPARGELRRRRSDVIKAGVSRAELDRLERAGVLELRGRGDAACYTGVDVELLDILADVRRLGLSDVFPAAVAEPYLAAVEALCALEVDMFRHRALSHGAPGSLPDVARQAISLGERLIVGLRAKILPAMLANIENVGPR